MLPVLDNFERASQSIQARTSGEAAVAELYSIVKVKLEEVLRQYGVEEMDCVGRSFDPLVHEAIMSEYSSEVRVIRVMEVRVIRVIRVMEVRVMRVIRVMQVRVLKRGGSDEKSGQVKASIYVQNSTPSYYYVCFFL